VGDGVKMLTISEKGQIIHETSRTNDAERDRFNPVNSISQLANTSTEGRLEPQFMLNLASSKDTSDTINYMVETDGHGLFEVRFHRLAHQGDDNVYEHAAEDGQINAY
jgi:hypothetical protein